MSGDRLFNVFVNPLAFLEVDEPWARVVEGKPDYEAVLRLLCTPGTDSDLDSLVARYKEISTESKRLFAAPYEESILQKLVWPLRNAKASYMVGNYIGTIALCGMVAEMAAILYFEISETTMNGQEMSEGTEQKLFGRSFEKLGQERRVDVLSAYGIIDKETHGAFEAIRNVRRGYLHLYSQEHSKVAKDAVQAFQAALTIIVNLIGQEVNEGKIHLKPAFVRYLDKKGLLESVQDTEK